MRGIVFKPCGPLISFTTVATETGELEFTWKGDNDYFAQSRMPLTVS